eukprot:SAG22_NODE_77_length_22125_cov_46.140016_7_plen_131_part_00
MKRTQVNKQKVGGDLKDAQKLLRNKKRPIVLDFEGMSLDPAENLVLRMAPDFMWQAGDDELAGARVYAVKKGASSREAVQSMFHPASRPPSDCGLLLRPTTNQPTARLVGPRGCRCPVLRACVVRVCVCV